MALDSAPPDAPRELRLEGFRLVASVFALGGLVLAAVVVAFQLGRWVESRSRPGPAMGADQGGPLSQVVTPAEEHDADREANYFDRAQGGERAPEPAREIGRARPGSEPAATGDRAAETARGDGGAAGPFVVQVFAGRDRDSADRLVPELEAAGYRVRIDTEKDGTAALYKVRVGGYPTDSQARAALAALRAKGFSGAWVTRDD